LAKVANVKFKPTKLYKLRPLLDVRISSRIRALAACTGISENQIAALAAKNGMDKTEGMFSK
jgi:hypothetical protein